MTLSELERRALELARQGDFGAEAAGVNRAIVDVAPTQQAAWTRLGRCHLEQRRFDDAIDALRAALALNPGNGVATNLLNEVRRQRAQTPTAAERTTTGFGGREFALLETLTPDEACKALAPRIDALTSALNASTMAERIVGARQRAGEHGSRLFHAGSCHSGGPGHVYVFHHGGRWEPQVNIGWFSSPPAAVSAIRAGIGFNMTSAGRDPERQDGPERAARHFEAFARAVERSWKRELAQWMSRSGGFLQHGSGGPEVELLPDRAVEWLINCRNPAAHGWIFVGRWFFLDRAQDASVMADRSRLARAVDEALRVLFPLWLAAFTGPESA